MKDQSMQDVMDDDDEIKPFPEEASSDESHLMGSERLCSTTYAAEAKQSPEIIAVEDYEYVIELPDAPVASQSQVGVNDDCQLEMVVDSWADSMNDFEVDQNGSSQSFVAEEDTNDNFHKCENVGREQREATHAYEEHNARPYPRGPRRGWRTRGYRLPQSRGSQTRGNDEREYRGGARGYSYQENWRRRRGLSMGNSYGRHNQMYREWGRNPSHGRHSSQTEANREGERARPDRDHYARQ